jgi:hypothetical protein
MMGQWLRCARETIVQRADAGTSGRVGRGEEEVPRAALEKTGRRWEFGGRLQERSGGEIKSESQRV